MSEYSDGYGWPEGAADHLARINARRITPAAQPAALDDLGEYAKQVARIRRRLGHPAQPHMPTTNRAAVFRALEQAASWRRTTSNPAESYARHWIGIASACRRAVFAAGAVLP